VGGNFNSYLLQRHNARRLVFIVRLHLERMISGAEYSKS
jgi:hypothetical protein